MESRRCLTKSNQARNSSETVESDWDGRPLAELQPLRQVFRLKGRRSGEGRKKRKWCSRARASCQPPHLADQEKAYKV